MSGELKRSLPAWTLVAQEFGENASDTNCAIPLWKDQAGQLELARIGSVAERRYRLRFADLISVDLHIPERTIIEKPIRPGVTQCTREHFLADQVLPRLLGHLGYLVLHAGAVRIEDGAILLIGESGAGKSTLAASFDKAGSPILGDDAVIISWLNDRPSAAAVYPSLRLFPDSISQLYPEAVPTAAVAHYTPKLRLPVPLMDGSQSDALPIRALFALGQPAGTSEIGIEPKSIAKTCMSLIENSFVLDPTDSARAPERLRAASRLASAVPAFDLCYPRAYSRLEDVRTEIIEALGRAA